MAGWISIPDTVDEERHKRLDVSDSFLDMDYLIDIKNIRLESRALCLSRSIPPIQFSGSTVPELALVWLRRSVVRRLGFSPRTPLGCCR